MRNKLILAALAVLGAACGNDASTVCDKFDECNALFGVSVAECEDAFDDAPEGKLSDCADCVSDKECSSINNGACNAECN